MAKTRHHFVAEGAIEASYYKTYQGGQEPDDAMKLARHFSNLFETPVLFYVGCLAGMATGVTGWPFLILACLYVAVRFAHAYVHTGSNRLSMRMRVYLLSWIVLLAMWALLVVRIAIAS